MLAAFNFYHYEGLWFAAKAFTELAAQGVDLPTLTEPVLTEQMRTQTWDDGVTGFVSLDPVTGDRIGWLSPTHTDCCVDPCAARVFPNARVCLVCITPCGVAL